MVWLADGEKKIEGMFIRFDRIHERDGHTDGRTDGRTPHDSIGRACIARQKVTKDPIGPQERRYATL